MPRYLPSKSSTERSQKLLQKLIAQPSFGEAILGQSVRWVSPVKSDAYAEYSDAQFLARLDIQPSHTSLKDFWPSGGPHWDGLGIAADNTVILVEAKAYIEEFDTDPSKATPASLKKIQAALEATRGRMEARPKGDWATSFYQMTNRLAHLYFLHALNRIPTELWLVCFCNHPDTTIRTTKEEWQGAIRLVESHLGIKGNSRKLTNRIRHVFIDANDLSSL